MENDTWKALLVLLTHKGDKPNPPNITIQTTNPNTETQFITYLPEQCQELILHKKKKTYGTYGKVPTNKSNAEDVLR